MMRLLLTVAVIVLLVMLLIVASQAPWQQPGWTCTRTHQVQLVTFTSRTVCDQWTRN